MVQRHYVDTNVFIAMLERSDERAERLLHLFTRGHHQDDETFLTSEITLAELLVLPYRQKDQHLISLYQKWIGVGSLIAAKAVGREILSAAANLRANDGALRLPDAIHLATALRFSCRRFLTFDSRLSRSPGRAQLVDSSLDILKPEAELLEQMIAEFPA
jgi:predicted nucleic acid-binding protein